MDERDVSTQELIQILSDGPDVWNNWRADNPGVPIELVGVDLRDTDLRGVDFSKAALKGADFRRADLRKAIFRHADLENANFSNANLGAASLDHAVLYRATFHTANLTGAFLQDAHLKRANLYEADMRGATATKANFFDTNMRKAKLTGANLLGANFEWAVLSEADLSKTQLVGANLSRVHLVEANLSDADMTGCRLYGVSAWNVELDGTRQCDLTITRGDEPCITADRLEVAQFLYLLLNNDKIKDVIDPITGRVVLILGSFSQHHKSVLDKIRDDLRQRDRLPVMFDFEKPTCRDLTETISLLAHLARYIIVDVSGRSAVPQELQRVVEGLPSVPVKPLIHFAEEPYSLFEHFERYPWVLEFFRYKDSYDLTSNLKSQVIDPLESYLAKETPPR